MSARILVVEDEPLIALELVEVLTAAGHTVIGPATDVAEALKLLIDRGCDAAVLDVNLGRETAAPIAEAMRSRALPFVIVSGYSKQQQPAAFLGAPFLPKPIDTAALMSVLRGLIK